MSVSDPHPDRDASLVVQVALVEYQKLRDEIGGRSSAQWTLVGLNVTGSGLIAGFAIADPGNLLLLLLLPFLTASLGMLFLDHAFNILRIGRHVDEDLTPTLRRAARDNLLMRYERKVYDSRRHIAGRMLPFGIPLVLLYNVSPIVALAAVLPAVSAAWSWIAWGFGVALTLVELGFWLTFLVQPLRRAP